LFSIWGKKWMISTMFYNFCPVLSVCSNNQPGYPLISI
jgi:hypothetical protein